MSYSETFEDLVLTQVEDVLPGAEYISCIFQGIDFPKTFLERSRIIDSSFENCNLSNISLLNTTLRNIEFLDCKILGVNFSTTVKISLLIFKKSILDFCVFHSVNGENFLFQSCSLKEVDFGESKFSGAVFSESNLLGSNFNATDLSRADFRSSINYNINPQFTKVTKAKFSSPEVLTLLSGFDIIVE